MSIRLKKVLLSASYEIADRAKSLLYVQTDAQTHRPPPPPPRNSPLGTKFFESARKDRRTCYITLCTTSGCPRRRLVRRFSRLVHSYFSGLPRAFLAILSKQRQVLARISRAFLSLVGYLPCLMWCSRNYSLGPARTAAIPGLLLEGGGEGNVAPGGQQKRRRQRRGRQRRCQLDRRRRRRGRCGWAIAADPVNLGVIYLERDGQVGQAGVAQHGIICKQ